MHPLRVFPFGSDDDDNGKRLIQTFSDLVLKGFAAAILGGTSFVKGKGGIAGTVLGVLVIGVSRNGLNVIGVPKVLPSISPGANAGIWDDCTLGYPCSRTVNPGGGGGTAPYSYSVNPASSIVGTWPNGWRAAFCRRGC